MLMPVATPPQLMQAHAATVEFIKSVLKEGTDYGVIPGTGDKPALLKAGAERLTAGYGLRPEYDDPIESECDHDRENAYTLTKWVKRDKPKNRDVEYDMKADGRGRNKKFGSNWVWQECEIEEGVSRGLYRYVIRCRLFLGDREVGQGVGSCSSMETKYIRSPRDSENTILKMAKKRAYVDAVLTTLGLSDRFTQDVEDMHADKAAVGDAEPIDAQFTEDVQEPQETATERYERQKAEAQAIAKSASDYLIKELGFDKADMAEYMAYCKEQGVSWVTTALDAKHKGIKTKAQFLMMIHEGETSVSIDKPAENQIAHGFELVQDEMRKFQAECKRMEVLPGDAMRESWKADGRTYDDLMAYLKDELRDKLPGEK